MLYILVILGLSIVGYYGYKWNNKRLYKNAIRKIVYAAVIAPFKTVEGRKEFYMGNWTKVALAGRDKDIALLRMSSPCAAYWDANYGDVKFEKIVADIYAEDGTIYDMLFADFLVDNFEAIHSGKLTTPPTEVLPNKYQHLLKGR